MKKLTHASGRFAKVLKAAACDSTSYKKKTQLWFQEFVFHQVRV